MPNSRRKSARAEQNAMFNRHVLAWPRTALDRALTPNVFLPDAVAANLLRSFAQKGAAHCRQFCFICARFGSLRTWNPWMSARRREDDGVAALQDHAFILLCQ
eukprot:3702801-Amphidinium_carterae.1